MTFAQVQIDAELRGKARDEAGEAARGLLQTNAAPMKQNTIVFGAYDPTYPNGLTGFAA